MEDVPNWDKLSWQERREARFQKWLDAPGVRFNDAAARAAYRARVERFIKAIKLEEPDRVPVLLPAGYLPATYSGGTFKDSMYDYGKLRDAWLKFMHDFQPDSFDGPGLVYPGRVIEIIDHKLHRWPGHGLPDNAPMYQYVEGEYMKADEYDDFMENPTDFWMRVFLPRTAGAFEGFQYLAPFQPVMTNPLGYIMSVSRPEVQRSFEKLLEASREIARWLESVGAAREQALAEGYASFGGGGMAGAPFDNIGDVLRGTRGIVADMFRRPDKVFEAMERLVPIIVKGAVRGADRSLSPVIMMPLHKGDQSFMSGPQFERFYWPTFKKVLLGLVEEGLVPYPFAEGNYEPRLEIIADMPRTAIVWHFEVMDMARAKKILGGVSCICGNVPTSLLVTGTAAQVRESCQKLIETCAPGGGYILTGGAGMNVGDANNLHVMMDAAREFGKYKK
jgi:uroporphyrinogen-III decarboxylase